MHTDFVASTDSQSAHIGDASITAQLVEAADPVRAAHRCVKPYYQREWEVIRRTFERDRDVKNCLRAHTQLMDNSIKACWTALAQRSDDPAVGKVALFATGGYGRKQLFPYSDVDLLIVTSNDRSDAVHEAAQTLLYILWDLGLKVGHAVRTVAECCTLSREDTTICSSLLDARILCGNTRLGKRMLAEFESTILGAHPKDYITAKLAERERRHRNHGDSRFSLEPHIKEGKGGLRDLHTLYWLARYVYNVRAIHELSRIDVLTKKEARQFGDAEQFLSYVRCWLHYHAGRAEERLTFDKQKALAEWEGVSAPNANMAVERFMKRYFKTTKAVGDLTRIVCAVLEQRYLPPVAKTTQPLPLAQQARFVVEGKRINFAKGFDVQSQPESMLELFQTAQWLSLDVHPDALQRISRHGKHIPVADAEHPKMVECFRLILRHPGNRTVTLQRLNESGVLSRIIPEFAALVGQMQYDMYHSFTVDEHVIRAIGVLEALEQEQLSDELPLSAKLMRGLDAGEVLYMAVLLHDIAKGMGGGHTDKGAGMAHDIAARLGFDEADCHTIAWLVAKHQLITDTAYKRDLQDDATIAQFVAEVQSLERLRLLLLVTIADVRAVGPKIWNAWKGALMRELYSRSENALRTGVISTDTAALNARMDAVRSALSHWHEEAWQSYLQNVDQRFWMSCSEMQHVRIAQLIEARGDTAEPVAIHYESQPDHAITELIICTENRQGLIADISGALAVLGANISMARLFLTYSGEAIVLLHIQNQVEDAYHDDRKLGKLGDVLAQIWNDGYNPLTELDKRPRYASSKDAFEVRTEILIDNELSDAHTIIEISTRDRPTLLARLTATLGAQGLQISAAHINTYGEKAVDVFYTKDRYGFKLVHWDAIASLKDALRETVHQMETTHA